MPGPVKGVRVKASAVTYQTVIAPASTTSGRIIFQAATASQYASFDTPALEKVRLAPEVGISVCALAVSEYTIP